MPLGIKLSEVVSRCQIPQTHRRRSKLLDRVAELKTQGKFEPSIGRARKMRRRWTCLLSAKGERERGIYVFPNIKFYFYVYTHFLIQLTPSPAYVCVLSPMRISNLQDLLFVANMYNFFHPRLGHPKKCPIIQPVSTLTTIVPPFLLGNTKITPPLHLTQSYTASSRYRNS